MQICYHEFIMSRFFYSIEPEGKQASLLVLLTVQILPILALGYGFFIYEEDVEQKEFMEQVQRIDEKHLINVAKSLQRLRPSRAMMSKDKNDHSMFYSSLATTSGFEMVDFKSSSRMVEDGLIPTDCKLVLKGDLYLLPVLIEMLQTSRVLSLIQTVEINVNDLTGSVVSFDIRVFRPDIPSENWLTGLQVSPEQMETLKKGWLLWNWRAYAKKELQLSEQAQQRFHTLKTEIPPKIIPLRKKRGKKLTWRF